MRKIVLLSLATSVLLLGGCGKQESSPSETPAVNNPASAATNAEKEATNAAPETHKPGQ